MKSWDHLQIYLGTNIHINLGFNNIITNTPPPQPWNDAWYLTYCVVLMYGDVERNFNTKQETTQQEESTPERMHMF